MEFFDTHLVDLKIIQPTKFVDHRGYFSETFNAKRLAHFGINDHFVQDNHSKSITVATLRGLHFQKRPFAQSKLVRVISGSIYDVAVDLRVKSPTFKQHFGIKLSAENGTQLYIPQGFAHGFFTLEPETEVCYKVDEIYDAGSDSGIRWNDPELAIDWPNVPESISEKDISLPFLNSLTEDDLF